VTTEWEVEHPQAEHESTQSPHTGTTPYESLQQQEISCTWPSCTQTFAKVWERDRHYTTVHANSGVRHYRCEIAECVADVKGWTTARGLRQHNKTWHGPHHCKFDSCERDFPNGFATRESLDTHWDTEHGGKSDGQYGHSVIDVSGTTLNHDSPVNSWSALNSPTWDVDNSDLKSNKQFSKPRLITTENPRSKYHEFDPRKC
jgi:hypothetical protein